MPAFGFAMATVLLVLLLSTPAQGQLSAINTGNPAVQQKIVDGHNDFRRKVQPPASNMLEMSWSNEAAVNAQAWADGCSMLHSPWTARSIGKSRCGENIYMSTHPDPWKHAIKSWYDEVKLYKYGSRKVDYRVVGHYTQLVWYRSNKVGCGVAYCPKSKLPFFYVCQYCPPGNFQNTLPYKAGKRCGKCPNACKKNLCTNPCKFFDKYKNCPSLTKYHGCTHPFLRRVCPACCKCTGKIV